jgi:hypothetical protein
MEKSGILHETQPGDKKDVCVSFSPGGIILP